MYQALLTRRYLTSKIMPLLAMAAVMLSVATVLITWSVMGGFLKQLLNSGRTLIGDVAIYWPSVGFPHYEDLVARLEADGMVLAAAPVIETFGMIRLPDGQVQAAMIKGVDGASFTRVTAYEDTLWWRPVEGPARKDRDRRDPRLDPDTREALERFEANGMRLTREDPETGRGLAAAVLGIEVTGLNRRVEGGVYVPMRPQRRLPGGGYEDLDVFMPRNGSVGLTLVAFDQAGNPVDGVTRNFPVANEFQSGIYDADSRTVLVRLDAVQSMLNMDRARRVTDPGEVYDPFAIEIDPETGEEIPAAPPDLGEDPARVTTVLVRAAGGVTADRLAFRAREIYREFADAHPREVPPAETIRIATWEDLNRTMIEAVRKETALVLFIFGIVCFTTVFLVLSIFWSMVNEKTKDIGVLRSLGAGTGGVAGLWLGYGAAIGVVGASLGVLVAWLVVRNINAIHDWMGTALGLTIWDPQVYYFVEIPSETEPSKVLTVLIAGVLTCLLGALIPAIRSATMDPVRALRFE